MTAAPAPTRWMPLLIGLSVLYALLQWLAAEFNSVRGEAGLIIAGCVLAAAIFLQVILFKQGFREAALSLGLGRPAPRGLLVAAAFFALLLVYPIYAASQNASLSLYPNTAWLALGILAQGGVAEEAVFRGYLFGHLRRTNSFWRAALISMAPFAFVHLFIFLIMPWQIALAAFALSVAISFPLAHLYELGGRTIWAAALAHALVQGAVKLIVVEPMGAFPIVWMVVSAAAPWLVFLVKRPSSP
ncbi:MAG: lysostaphin resistance A-like protein [Hyphomonadaceae bacterium]